MKTLSVLCSFAAAAALSTSAAAQQYPTRNVTMLVPYAAGGPTDTVARVLAQSMSKPLGQTVVVENRPSAGGILAPEQVKNAKPDGYTILIHHIGMATTPALYRQLRFNPLTDFDYIGLMNDVPMTLIARGDFPAKDFKEFLAYIKANKDKVTYANAGIGAASHLCGMLFKSAIETDFLTVPYKGTAPGDERPARRPGGLHVRPDHQHHLADQGRQGEGVRRDLGKRVPSLKEIPTLDEQGLKGFEVGIWHGLYAPKGTPQAGARQARRGAAGSAQGPAVQKRFTELGATTYPPEKATPAALQAHLKAEIDKWGPLIKKAGVYAD